MLFNLQLLVKKRMSGDERINAPPVCIFQIIVALYQSRTPLGSNVRVRFITYHYWSCGCKIYE